MEQILRVVWNTETDTETRARVLAEALEKAAVCPEIRCVTVTGEGDTFLTGTADKDTEARLAEAFGKNPVPVVLAVNGALNGIGREVLERADLAIAGGSALIGEFKGKEAEEQYAVNEIVPDELLLKRTEDYAQRLLSFPAELIRFGHKAYFALEKLPDRASRARFSSENLQMEIIGIQSRLKLDGRKAGADGTEDETKACAAGTGAEPEVNYEFPEDAEHAVLFEFRNDVEYIQLNTPGYGQRFDWRSSMELAGAYAVGNTVPGLKAIAVTGTGGKFHLGGIRHHPESSRERRLFSDQLDIRNRVMRGIHVPLIAAVNGECSGGGMSLPLKADYVIASKSARFGYPEIRHNDFACNAMVNTMGVIPKKAALKCFYFGELFTASDAERFGIVDRVAEDGMLAAELEKVLEQIRAGREDWKTGS